MARLAVALIGGIIGALIPGIGWSIGFLVGNVIGSILFPPKGPDGPRLTNLQVTSSIYGTMINQGYGTVRVPGNMIWGLNIKEKKHSAGKGLGGSGATGTTYTYSWTGAIALGRGPIRDVIRIWADTKLVYDKTGNTPQKALPSKRDFSFRLYKGTETQLPDPAFEKDVGTVNANANRGIAYVVFDNIQLANFGNRIPSFTFEAAWAGQDNTTVHDVTQITTGPLSANENSSILAVDWDRDRFYTGVTGVTQGYRQYSLGTMTEVTQQVVTHDVGFLAVISDDTAALYAPGGTSNTQPLFRYEGDGIVNLFTFGTSSSGTMNETTGFVAAASLDFVRPAGLTGIDPYLLVGSTFNDVGLIHATDMTYVWGKELQVAEGRVTVCGGEPALDEANGWALGYSNFGGPSSASFTVYKIRVMLGAYVGTNQDTGANNMVFMNPVHSFSPSDIHAGWTQFNNVGQFIFDESDNTLIVAVSGGPDLGPYTGYICKFDPGSQATDGVNRGAWNSATTYVLNDVVTDVGVKYIAVSANTNQEPPNATYWSPVAPGNFKWKTPVGDGIIQNTKGHNQSRLQGQKYAWLFGSTLYEISTIDGSLTTTPSIGASLNGVQVYDSNRDAILCFATVSAATQVVLLLLSRGVADSNDVSAIINDVCSQVGLDPLNDVDTSGISDTVRGYLINQQMTARSAIEPLGFANLFDGAEIDYKLRFIKRGQAVALTVVEDDLVRANDETGGTIEETRTQEVELPKSVSIIYMDFDKDYQQNTMTARRVSNPVPTMYSRNDSTTTVPIVMTATEALRIADRAMWSAWTERVTHKYKLDWGAMAFDPTDVVQINMNNGDILHDRVISGDIGADFSMEWTSISERSVQYTSNATGDGGDGFVPQNPPGALSASRYFLMDIPFLRDQDAAAGANSTVSTLHTAASSYGTPNWPGEIILKSADGSNFIPAATITSACAWGVTSSALGPVSGGPFCWDEINTVTISMINGADELVSTSKLNALSGANAGILLNEFTGVVEIIGFTTVTANPDGSFTLSELMRGQRGTEVYTDAHTAGEIFLIPDPTTFSQISMGLDELNAVRYFLGVQVGDLNEEGTQKTISDTGRDLKPWAPVHMAAAVAGSDLHLTWERRTRFGGGLMDLFPDVPLFEASEKYEIDIYNGSTVVRTLTSVTTSVTYLAANITTDFGSIPATLTMEVYQISASVGRGFGKKVTVSTS